MFWITGILGLALGVSPWIFNYTDNTNAMWASIILGAAILLVSAYKAVMRDTENWEYWVIGLVGLVAVIAPFVLNFSALFEALWASIIVGVAAALVSGYEVFFVRPQTP